MHYLPMRFFNNGGKIFENHTTSPGILVGSTFCANKGFTKFCKKKFHIEINFAKCNRHFGIFSEHRIEVNIFKLLTCLS